MYPLGRPGVTQGTVLRGFVVNLSLCRPLTDFGQGFYTTTSLHQAREWANARVRRVLAPTQQHTAVVIQFSLDRDWLARLDALAFARFLGPRHGLSVWLSAPSEIRVASGLRCGIRAGDDLALPAVDSGL
jgi:hypothetical protein